MIRAILRGIFEAAVFVVAVAVIVFWCYVLA